MTREYAALSKLRGGEILPLPKEGVSVRMIPGEIKPGDWYVGERNTGPELLTCESVDPRNWINPKEEFKYPYDNHECVRVEVLEAP